MIFANPIRFAAPLCRPANLIGLNSRKNRTPAVIFSNGVSIGKYVKIES